MSKRRGGTILRLFKRIFTCVTIAVVLAVFPAGVLADEDDSFTNQIEEWEEQGIDPNHTEVIDEIRAYISEHIEDDVFSSLHIDRDKSDLGVIVLSFTEELNSEHEAEMKQLVTEPAEVEIRYVEFSEEELMSKQQEIDSNGFEYDRFTIHFTGVDVTENAVKVGIEPYNEENSQVIYDQYGSEMVNVVEGEQPVLLDDSSENMAGDVSSETIEATENDRNFIQNIFHSVKNWFSNLF